MKKMLIFLNVKNKVEDINTFLKQGRSDSFPFDDIVEAIHHIV